MLLLLQGSYAAWTVYGWSIHNRYIVASSFPAFLLGIVLLYQWWTFHPHRTSL